MGVLRGKIGEGWCDIDPNELVLTFRGSYVCVNLVKLIKKCNRVSAHRWNDRCKLVL